MLFSERKRERETAEREAAGENLWREEFGAMARERLGAIADAYSNALTNNRVYLGSEIARRLRYRVGHVLPESYAATLKECSGPVLLDWLGAAYEVIEEAEGEESAEQFASVVNAVLRQERVGYKFVDGSMVEFSSDELITEVVEPAVRLLVGKQFNAAHGAYMNALKEITNGEPGDAITDAGTALQETLKALGCEGDVLSMLIKDAKDKDLFKSHDQQLHEALVLVMKWAASERNKQGDAHKHSDATLADAWLIVHVVGALIVRLADGTQRGSSG